MCCLQVALYLSDGTPSPTYPVAGQMFMPLQIGDVVDVVLQNQAANANGAPSACSFVQSSADKRSVWVILCCEPCMGL